MKGTKMQDRFKLRCFGKPNAPKIIQGMHDIKYIEIGEKGYYNIRFEENWISFVEKDQLELMQCTGLKDKNSKLIYEGDIVKLNNTVYIVNFDNFNSRFILRRTKSCRRLVSYRHYEVIGNEFENPELLEGKND